MKTKKTNLSATRLNGFWAALFILTLVSFSLSQTTDVSANAPNKTKQTYLNFVNRSKYPVSIHQSVVKKEKFFKQLNASESYLLPSPVAQLWRVRLNGIMVGNYRSTSSSRQEIEITVRQVEAPNKIKNQKDAENQCANIANSTGGVWIGKWGSLGAGQLSFCEFGYLRSEDSNEPELKEVSLSFINKIRAKVSVFWVEDNGQENLYGQIVGGATHPQMTFNTHKWRLKTTDGKILGEYIATDQVSQKIKIVNEMLEVPASIRSRNDAEQHCQKLTGSNGGIWTGRLDEPTPGVFLCNLVRLRTSSDSK